MHDAFKAVTCLQNLSSIHNYVLFTIHALAVARIMDPGVFSHKCSRKVFQHSQIHKPIRNNLGRRKQEAKPRTKPRLDVKIRREKAHIYVRFEIGSPPCIDFAIGVTSHAPKSTAHTLYIRTHETASPLWNLSALPWCPCNITGDCRGNLKDGSVGDGFADRYVWHRRKIREIRPQTQVGK